MKSAVVVSLGAIALCAVFYLATGPAESQSAGSFVALQSSTPGTAQNGNANLSGTIKAGQFVGGGGGISGVNADLLDGINSTAFLQSIPLPFAGTVSTSSAGFKVTNSGSGSGLTGESVSGAGVFGHATANTGSTYGVYGLNSSTSGIGVLGTAQASNGFSYGGYFLSSSTSGTGVFGQGSVGVRGNGTVVGVHAFSTAPLGRGVWGIASGGSETGVSGEASSTSGKGVFGHATANTGSTYGVYGLNNSTDGIGVLGTAQASNGFSYGGYFLSSSTSGTGVYGQGSVGVRADGVVVGVHAFSTAGLGKGVWGVASGGDETGVSGEASSTSGTGVYGHATADTGFTYGMYGLNDSVSGIGVLGTAQASSGVNFGVYGVSDSSEGRGVFGHATSATGFTIGAYGLNSSPNGIGVLGTAETSNGINYGVVGVTNSVLGWGIYSYGRSGASGTKSFRIDHPQDPENKWLLHYCSEGPEPLNVYGGTITTDAKGFATIELPAYFDEINRDPRVQLTVDDNSDDFVLAKVVDGVNHGACRVRTSKPHVKVYWEVKAVRSDPWVQKYGAPVEVEKQGREKGKYQHPELYGAPPEMGMNFVRERGKGENIERTRP